MTEVVDNGTFRIRRNRVVAMVNGTKCVLSSSQLQYHIDIGDDVEVITDP